jgi:hypothetical protein
MWVFTKHGFISSVQHHSDPDMIVVRARDKRSLERISNKYGVDIVRLGGTDYPHRVYVTREQFTEYMASEAENVDYTNYKNKLHVTRGDVYYDAATSVWSTMHHVQDVR